MNDGRILVAPDVQRALRGLMITDAGRGLRKTLFNIAVANGLLFLTLTTEPLWLFIPLAILTGFFYTTIMITTHDAMHHTLTGWYWFDELVPRFYSYFIFWPHGLYSELHKLHHKYNGRDLEDPENPTFTEKAYKAAGPVRKFLMRNRIPLALFVYGGIGLIIQHFREGFARWHSHPPVRRLIITDIAGILVATSVTCMVLYWTGVTWRYVAYLALVERFLGFAMQLRLHIEHYGLWGERTGIIETRLYNCRNIETNAFGRWFYNGLNFHSVHHAFPAIPYYHLKEATARVEALCQQGGGDPLPSGQGYFQTIAALASHPVFIPDAAASDLKDGRDPTHDKVS